jgi:xylulokinase
MAYVIGCDVGSQSLKGVLVDNAGEIVGQASAPYELHYPHSGWADQDPDDWLRALREVVARLLKEQGIVAGEVGTLGLASQVDGVVAVGSEGKHLRPAIIWMDRRAEAQREALGQQIPPERIFEVTGLNLDSTHVAPKILWLRDEEPEVYEDATSFSSPAATSSSGSPARGWWTTPTPRLPCSTTCGRRAGRRRCSPLPGSTRIS